MTREEAIQELQNCKGLIQQDGQYYLDERDIPIIDMAIEALQADAVSREEYDKLIQELNDSPKGKWIPLDRKLPKIIGEHVLVTIKWADDDLEVCEMCPTIADRYNIIAFQQMPLPYDGEPLKSELQKSCERAEQTEYKLPFQDEIMEKLDKLTLKPKKKEDVMTLADKRREK